MGTTDQVTSLDPADAYDRGSWDVFNNVFQTLMTVPAGADQPVPDAAQSCGFTDANDTTYRCTLRDNLRFSNGDPLTGEDVAYSLARTKAINSSRGPASLLSVLSATQVAGRQITFHLVAPDATWPLKLATGAASIVDHRVYPEDRPLRGNRLVGSGPYQVQSYTPGRQLDLAPNPRYSGAAHRVNSGATIRYYATAQQLATALKKQDIDFVPGGLPPKDEAAYDSTTGEFHTIKSSSPEAHYLVFDTTHAPFNNPEARLAVAWALDRESLARDVYARTVVPLYSLIPQGISGHTTPYFDRYGATPDPTKAKAALAAAHIPQPVHFTLTVSSGSAADLEASVLKQQLEATGAFNVAVRHVGWTEFQQGWAAHRYDAFTVGWFPDYRDADNFIAPLIGHDGVFHTGYDNHAVDDIISRTRAMPSRAAAGSLVAKAQDTEATDIPVLPLWQGQAYTVARANITGLSMSNSDTGVTNFAPIGVGSAG